MNLPKNIRRLRMKDKLTQCGLAAMVRISKVHMCRIEKGLAYPSPKVLARIATVLKTTPGKLID